MGFKKALSCLDLPVWWSRDSEWISGASVALRKLFSCLDLPGGWSCDCEWIPGASVAAGLDLQRHPARQHPHGRRVQTGPTH